MPYILHVTDLEYRALEFVSTTPTRTRGAMSNLELFPCRLADAEEAEAERMRRQLCTRLLIGSCINYAVNGRTTTDLLLLGSFLASLLDTAWLRARRS